MTGEFQKSKRTKINRLPARGHYDKETINNIIDTTYFCHVSFVIDEQPFIIPAIHARIDNTIVLHGAKTSRMRNHIIDGNEVCIAFTIMDGLVLARSVFHHSMNYRSAIVYGKGRAVKDFGEKEKAFQSITNHILPGRWEDARRPNKKEIDSTSVVSINIEEASAKIRTGPPLDDEDDYSLSIWAGVLPLQVNKRIPVEDPKLEEGIILPEYIENFKVKGNSD